MPIITRQRLYQTWDGSAWVNGYLNTFTYDANNNLAKWVAAIVECQYYIWDSQFHFALHTMVIISNGYLVSLEWYFIDTNSPMHLFYDANNNRRIHQQVWSGSTCWMTIIMVLLMMPIIIGFTISSTWETNTGAFMEHDSIHLWIWF